MLSTERTKFPAIRRRNSRQISQTHAILFLALLLLLSASSPAVAAEADLARAKEQRSQAEKAEQSDIRGAAQMYSEAAASYVEAGSQNDADHCSAMAELLAAQATVSSSEAKEPKDLTEALELLKKAASYFEKQANHDQLGAAYYYQAIALGGTSTDHAEIAALYEKAAAQFSGESRSLNNAKCRARQGIELVMAKQYDLAKAILEIIVQGDITKLDAEEQSLSLGLLRCCLNEKNDYKSAFEYGKRASTIFDQQHTVMSPYVAMVREGYANAAAMTDQYAPAYAQNLQLVDYYLSKKDDYNASFAWMGLAISAQECGKLADVKSRALRIESIAKTLKPSTESITACQGLAGYYKDCGDVTKTIFWMQKNVDARKAFVGPDDPSTKATEAALNAYKQTPHPAAAKVSAKTPSQKTRVSSQFDRDEAPATIAQAIAIVKAISDSDPKRQSELRARKAIEIVSNQVSVLNDGWGTFLQTVPVDFWNRFSKWSSIKSRSEALDAFRSGKVDSAEAAWFLGGGFCAEHAALVTRIMVGAGERARVYTSTAPHDFPVVNLAPDAVADIPWTWGKDFLVADSWSGNVLTDPWAVWLKSIYFNLGRNHVTSGSDKNPMREKLDQFINHGQDWIEKGHCTEYQFMVKKFMMIPSSYRPDPSTYPPKNICTEEKSTWVGKWVDDGRPAEGPGMGVTIAKVKGQYTAKSSMNPGPIEIQRIADTTFDATWTLNGMRYDFHLTITGPGAAKGSWRCTNAEGKFHDFPWKAKRTNP